MTESSNIMPFPNLKTLQQEAAEWVVLLDDEEYGREYREEFWDWYDKSEQNKEIFDQLAKDWNKLDELRELKRNYTTQIDSSYWWHKFLSLDRRKAFGLAASFLLITMAIVISSISNVKEQVFETEIGERKSAELIDGSQIDLNTNTEIKVELSPEYRNVHLIRGEAFFNVSHDPERPFSVFAGGGVVTAIGTAFSVTLTDKTVDVIVSDGLVSLAVNKDINSGQVKQIAQVSAGQDATIEIDKRYEIDDLEFEEVSRRLSWRNGILSFKGEELSSVVHDMSRYTDYAITIEDEDLKRFKVDGQFRVGEVKDMLEALGLMTNIRIEYLSEKEVRITKLNNG